MLENALSGLTVLDFGQLIAGPVCGMWLADMGATVVKVEPPGGELARSLGPPWQNGESLTALTSNRNKLALSIDLKRPEAIETIRRMVLRTDIVVENFRPGVASRLGIDHEALSAIRSDLITCSLSAFGQAGPWRDRPGVDGIIQAVTGVMSGINAPDGSPGKVPLPLADMAGALFAAMAILGALRRRDTTGQGAHLDISLYNSMLMLQQLNLAAYLNSGRLPERTGSAAPYAAVNEALPTLDGWIMVGAYQDVRWRKLCELINRTDLMTDLRFATNAGRVAERPALLSILQPIFRKRTSAEWLSLLRVADILAGPVADYSEVAGSEQYAASGIEIEIDHPKAGRFRMPGFALGTIGAMPAKAPPPLTGQDSRDVLTRFGFADTEIETLISNSVVFTGEAA
jgi:crotonobetainyl-CoA:carnitine CoA-transferase CaiB-like acyl-CoA transferase